MCLHRIPKGNCWVHLHHRSEGKIFVAKHGSFLEKEFLSKEVNGRKVELERSSSLKLVPVMPTPISEEVNDHDHETSDQVTTEPRRSTRVFSGIYPAI